MRKEYYQTAGEIIMLPFERIIPHPKRSAESYGQEQLLELSASIAENGLLEPIVVKQCDGDSFEIVAGERRYRACVAVGMMKIPCIVLCDSDFFCAIYSLVDNQQHEPISCFEEAEIIQKLLCEYQISVMELSGKLCKTVGYINKKLKLLTLSEEIREIIIEQNYGEEFALALLAAPEQDRKALLEQIVNNRYSINDAFDLIEKAKQAGQKKTNIMVFKDITVFSNTVEHAVDVMERAGIDARSEKTETEEYIEYKVRIKKSG